MTPAEARPADEPDADRRPFVGLWAPIAAITLWVVLAVRTPTNTFHFAPIVVAMAWPILRRVDAGRPIPQREAIVASATGVVLAVVVGAVLSLTGNLDGPTFWGDGESVVDDPLFEVVVFALAGGLAGYLVASLQGPGR